MSSFIVYVHNPYSLEGPQTVVVAGRANRSVRDPSVCPITGLPLGARPNPYRQRLVSYIKNANKSTLAVVVPRDGACAGSPTDALPPAAAADAPSSPPVTGATLALLDPRDPVSGSSFVSGPSSSRCSVASDDAPSISKSISDDEGSLWDDDNASEAPSPRRPSLLRSRPVPAVVSFRRHSS